MSDGVSFVVPVYDGARHLERVLDALLAQRHDGPLEFLVVDDGSADGSPALVLRRAAADPRVRLLRAGRLGATGAINVGLRAAAHLLIAQVDQDVIPDPDWLPRLVAAIGVGHGGQSIGASPRIAAAQARYVSDPQDGPWVAVGTLDLEERWAAQAGKTIDHVCTGNTLYRAEALREVGLFREGMGYGYDNDMSYRLVAAGWRLVVVREATALHRLRPGLAAYLARQYGYGYGRLDLIARHPGRVSGDRFSGPLMILHAAGMTLALASLAVAVLLAPLGLAPWALAGGGAVVVLLALERAIAGARAALRLRSPAALLYPLAHLLRDVAWAGAVATWTARLLTRRRPRPEHSMFRAD